MKFPRLVNLVFTVFLVIPFLSFNNPYTNGDRTPVYDDGMPVISLANMETDILRFVNLHRRSVGLKPLQYNDIESAVAGRHSYNMATGKLPFGHKDLQKRMNIIARQIGYVSATGENVAYGQMSAKEVVEGWLKSPGHRRNIEGDFTLTGIGIAKDRKGGIYYTQIFTK